MGVCVSSQSLAAKDTAAVDAALGVVGPHSPKAKSRRSVSFGRNTTMTGSGTIRDGSDSSERHRDGSGTSSSTRDVVHKHLASADATDTANATFAEARAEVLRRVMGGGDEDEDEDEDEGEDGAGKSNQKPSKKAVAGISRAQLQEAIREVEEGLAETEEDQTAAERGVPGADGAQEPNLGRSRSLTRSRTMSRTNSSTNPEYDDFEVTETSHVETSQVEGRGLQKINQYIGIKTLGQGAVGIVKLCMDAATGRMYAMKEMKRKSNRNLSLTDSGFESLRKEVAVMKKLKHPNCTRLFEIIEDSTKSTMLLVLEYVPGGALKSLFHEKGDVPYEPLELCLTLRDCMAGLEYLHANRIAHRDVKPENFLKSSIGALSRTGGCIKIADFGVSAIMGTSGKMHDTAGTPAFMSPEAIEPEDFDGYLADVWALGVCAFNFVFCALPFTGSNQFKVYKAIRENPVVLPDAPPDGGEVRADLRGLILGMLAKSPSERVSLAKAMANPFLTFDGEFDDLVLTADTALVSVSASELSSAVKSDVVGLVAANTVIERFAPGEDIMRQGDKGASTMYILETGEADVIVADEATGQEVLVATRRQGDIVGEAALFSEENVRTATVRARTEVEALVANRSDVAKISKGRRGSITALMASRAEETQQALQQNTQARLTPRGSAETASEISVGAPVSPRVAEAVAIAEAVEPSMNSDEMLTAPKLPGTADSPWNPKPDGAHSHKLLDLEA